MTLNIKFVGLPGPTKNQNHIISKYFYDDFAKLSQLQTVYRSPVSKMCGKHGMVLTRAILSLVSQCTRTVVCS